MRTTSPFGSDDEINYCITSGNNYRRDTACCDRSFKIFFIGQYFRYHFDSTDTTQRAGLDGIGAEIAKHFLHGHYRDCGHRVAAKRGDHLDIDLGPVPPKK